MKAFILASAALATIATGSAIAQAQGSDAPMTTKSKKLMRDDKNRDGVITREEALSAAGRKFDKKDRNKDGKLDQTELAKKGKGGKRMASAEMPAQPYDDQ